MAIYRKKKYNITLLFLHDSGTLCALSKRPFGLLDLGKRAYVCRDCGMVVRKKCINKVEQVCENSSLPKMEL